MQAQVMRMHNPTAPQASDLSTRPCTGHKPGATACMGLRHGAPVIYFQTNCNPPGTHGMMTDSAPMRNRMHCHTHYLSRKLTVQEKRAIEVPHMGFDCLPADHRACGSTAVAVQHPLQTPLLPPWNAIAHPTPQSHTPA
jgi:hypothetical protein